MKCTMCFQEMMRGFEYPSMRRTWACVGYFWLKGVIDSNCPNYGNHFVWEDGDDRESFEAKTMITNLDEWTGRCFERVKEHRCGHN